MTLVNWILLDNEVHIVADTIISDPDDCMNPVCFTNKVYLLPHLHGLMFGTGLAPFILEWFHTISSSLLVKDIRHLDKFTPQALQKIFKRYQDSLATFHSNISGTIYHIGYDEELERFVGYIYRSTDDFKSEEMQYGYHYKPHPETALHPISVFPTDFISIAKIQKSKDESKPISERVGIGGHLIAYTMRKENQDDGSYQINTHIHRCHEFDDFPRSYEKAVSKLPN